MGIRTHLELQFGTSIITSKTFHLGMVVSFVDSSIPCTHSAHSNNRDSSVNRPNSSSRIVHTLQRTLYAVKTQSYTWVNLIKEHN